MGWRGRAKRTPDMRILIENLLAEWELGSLVAVVGPERTNNDWYKLIVKYRPPGNEHRADVQFYDKNIDINIGYTRKGGYWNRRCIRLAIDAEGRDAKDEQRAAVVWGSVPRALTTGRNEDGAFEL